MCTIILIIQQRNNVYKAGLGRVAVNCTEKKSIVTLEKYDLSSRSSGKKILD